MEIIGDATLLRDLHHKELTGTTGRRRRRLLLGTPGLKAGAVDASRRHALADAGILADHFDMNFGVSASSWNAAAYNANQAHLVPEIYPHLSEIPFFFTSWMGDWINIEYVASFLRGDVRSDMRLDEATIRASRCDLIIGTSDLYGNLVLHDAKQANDIVDLCCASSALPLVTCTRHIDGEVRLDGGCANPCPVVDVLKDTRIAGDEIDILLIASRPRPENHHWIEQWMYAPLVHAWLWWYPWELRMNTAAIDAKMGKVVRMFEKQRPHSRFRMCAIFPTGDECISPIESRAEKVRSAGKAAYGSFAKFLEKRPLREL